VSIAGVRRTSGITSEEISDNDVQQIILEAESEVERLLNTKIIPQTVIEKHDGDMLGTDCETLFLDHAPILQLKECKIDGTSVSAQYIHVYPNSGKLILDDDAQETTWDDDDPKTNVIKYVYGELEPTTTQTETSAAVTSPTEDYSLQVDSTTGFADNDWIRIEGMDGYTETTQIDSISNGSMQVDIVLPHETDSIVTVMTTPRLLYRLVEVIASLMMVAREVGQSYDDIVGYSLEGLQVQLGEPYTQWRETAVQLRKEYDDIIKHYRIKPVVR